MKYSLIMLTIIVFSITWAQNKEIVTEGSYLMSDGETPAYAEDRAFDKAKMLALEQAGTYVQAQTVMQNFQVVQDDVMALSGGLMEITILEEKRNYGPEGLVFYAKVKAIVDTSDIEEIKEMIANKTIIEEYRQLKEDFQTLAAENEKLKQALVELKNKNDEESEASRMELLQKMRNIEEEYRSRRAYQNASSMIKKVKKDKDPEAWQKKREKFLKLAVMLDAKFVNPVVSLAEIEKNRGNKRDMEFLLEKAKKINPKRAEDLMKHRKWKDDLEDHDPKGDKGRKNKNKPN